MFPFLSKHFRGQTPPSPLDSECHDKKCTPRMGRRWRSWTPSGTNDSPGMSPSTPGAVGGDLRRFLCRASSDPTSYQAGSRTNGSNIPSSSCTLVDIEEPQLDWKSSSPQWCDGSVYKRGPVIGEGANSIVYAACRPNHKTTYALKALKKGCMSKAIREIFILKRLAGGPNIIEFHEAFVDGISNLPALVFKIVPPTSWMDISPTFSQEDQKRYSFQVIMALQYAHSKGIIHRDVKPQNIMIDQEKGELRLIDWGVAEVYVPDQDFTVHVGTGYYKPPEILLGQRRYDYSFDMWSVGCVLAAMVFQVEVFFKGTDDVDQLATIVELLGGADLRAYASKSNILMTPEVLEVVSTCRTKRTRLDSLTRLSAGPGTCLLVDLIDRLLQYDPEERLTATEALMHPYFASLSEAHA